MLLDGHTTCVGWPFLFSSQLALVKDETRPSAPTARSLVHAASKHQRDCVRYDWFALARRFADLDE